MKHQNKHLALQGAKRNKENEKERKRLYVPPPPHVFSVVKTLFFLLITLTLTLSFTSCGDKDGGGGSGGGGLTIKDIPSKFDGFYAGDVYGAGESANVSSVIDSGENWILIKNGSVNIPLSDSLTISGTNIKTGNYSGSDTCTGTFLIKKTKDTNVTAGGATVSFDEVKFSNGSATISWNKVNALEW